MRYIEYSYNVQKKIYNNHILHIYEKYDSGGDNEYKINNGKLKKIGTSELNKIFMSDHNEIVKICYKLLHFLPNNLNIYLDAQHRVRIYEENIIEDITSHNIEIFLYNIELDYIPLNDFNNFIVNKLNYLRVLTNIPKIQIRLLRENKYFVFSSAAAASLSHELLGHIFEKDNFLNYNYSKLISNIERLKLTILDDPTILGANGYYIYDDAFNKGNLVKIMDKGIFSGNLIGGSVNNQLINNSLRREKYSDKLYPRTSNLIVSTNKIDIYPSSYIKIIKLKKCLINHREQKIYLEVQTAYYVYENEIKLLIEPFNLELDIEDMLNRIWAVSKNGEFHPFTCQKQNQLVSCSTSSNEWLTYINSCNF